LDAKESTLPKLVTVESNETVKFPNTGSTGASAGNPDAIKENIRVIESADAILDPTQATDRMIRQRFTENKRLKIRFIHLLLSTGSLLGFRFAHRDGLKAIPGRLLQFYWRNGFLVTEGQYYCAESKMTKYHAKLWRFPLGDFPQPSHEQ
jgi:hypothetical protein